MTYTRFQEIWNALVTNRALPPATGVSVKTALNNGFSDKTIDALVAEAEGDPSAFDEVERKLSA